MPQIDFYIVDNSSPEGWLRYACKIVEKAYTMGMHVHIHTADESMTSKMDDLLWIFNDQSFIPHQHTCTENELCAVTLNHNNLPSKHELLVNLTTEVPDFYRQFDRVVEIISDNDVMKQHGRNRYKFYKEHGESPSHHQVALP